MRTPSAPLPATPEAPRSIAAPAPVPIDPSPEPTREPTAEPAEPETTAPSTGDAAPSLSESLASAMNAEDPTRRPSADFDKAAATAALAAAADGAASCRSAGSPPGTAYVSVIFGSSGRVESARVTNPPYVGTKTAECISERMTNVKVSSFRGKNVAMTHKVRVR
jgi:hypothetical protein